MATPHVGRPQQATGLPPGVEVGPLGRRFVAYLIDSVVPGILGALLGFLLPTLTGTARTVLSFVFFVLILGWAVLVWRMIAVQAASPGLRIMKLQIVGFYDGRPIGWGRAFLRALVLGLLSLTGIGLVIMLALLLMHPRKQGWHDLAAKAVVIKERVLPPAPGAPGAAAVQAAPEAYAGPQYAPSSGPSPQYDPARQYAPSPGYGPGPQPDSVQPPEGYHSPAYEAAGPPPAGYAAAPPAAPGPVPPAPPAPGAGPTYGRQQRPSNPFSQPSAAPQPPVSSSSGSVPQGHATATTSPNGAAGGWVAELDDGREVAVDGLVLLGRNPQPQPGEEDAQLIKLADETRTVSKSHLAIGLDAAGLFVVDRGSTNGSTVTDPRGVSSRVQPGQIVYLDEESIVSIGDHWLRIRRAR